MKIAILPAILIIIIAVSFYPNAYFSSQQPMAQIIVKEISPTVISLNDKIEFTWKVSGINDFGEKGHTNLHCVFPKQPGTFAKNHFYINSPLSIIKEIDWTKHSNMDLISEPIGDYEPDGFHTSIKADSKNIYYCRVHASDGTNDALSRIFEFETLDLRQMIEPESKIGKLYFDKGFYNVHDRAVILTYVATFLNKDPEKADEVNVDVSSTSNKYGTITLTETEKSSGVFEKSSGVFTNTILLCPVWVSCAGNQLGVLEGDLISAYVPETGATAHSMISGGTPSSKRASISEINLVDEEGRPINELALHKEIIVQSDLTNNEKREQEGRFIVQILDSEGTNAFLSSQKAIIPASGSINLNQQWTPDAKDLYTIQIFFWENFEHPVPLAEMRTLVTNVS